MLNQETQTLNTLEISVLVKLGGTAGLASPLVKRVVVLFQQEANTMVDGISTAFANTDLEQVFRLAHSLKSSSLAIGAYALADIAKQIEYAAKRQQDMQLHDLIKRLRVDYQQLVRILAGL